MAFSVFLRGNGSRKLHERPATGSRVTSVGSDSCISRHAVLIVEGTQTQMPCLIVYWGTGGIKVDK